jgi:hypothetical protein
MNSMFGFPPDQNTVRITYHPIFIELVPCSGERLGIGVVADDGERWHVEAANRWTDVAAAIGKPVGLLPEVVAEVVRFYKEELAHRKNLSELVPPFSTVFIGEQRITAGATLAEALQNALRLATFFHHPLNLRPKIRDIALVMDEFSLGQFRKKDNGRLLKLVQSETVRRDPKLRPYFGRALNSADKRIQPSIGFLSPFIAADFVSVRPKQVRASTRNARSYMQLLLLARKQSELRRDAPQILYLQRPNRSDPLWSDSDLDLVGEACRELSLEASQLEIIPKIEEDISDIVDDIMTYASAA